VICVSLARSRRLCRLRRYRHSRKLAAQSARFLEQAECTVICHLRASPLILGTRQQQTKNDVSKILALLKNAATFFDFMSVADIEQRSG
jgi:hypothetical protein